MVTWHRIASLGHVLLAEPTTLSWQASKVEEMVLEKHFEFRLTGTY